jgi:hypothetical protein
MVKTCKDCKQCKVFRRGYFCIAEDDNVRLPIQNLITDQSDCDQFMEV